MSVSVNHSLRVRQELVFRPRKYHSISIAEHVSQRTAKRCHQDVARLFCWGLQPTHLLDDIPTKAVTDQDKRSIHGLWLLNDFVISKESKILIGKGPSTCFRLLSRAVFN
jgi:hypothetical protein